MHATNFFTLHDMSTANHKKKDMLHFLRPLSDFRVPRCAKPSRRGSTSAERLAEGEAFVGGQKWKSRFTAPTQMEADRIHVAQGNRVPHLTDTDRTVLAAAMLSIQKATVLKDYWATGLSTLDTANALKGQPGFSRRIIDDFWAAFYEAERRDLERTE